MLSSILDATECVVLVLDGQSRIVFANGAMLRMAGARVLNDIIGLPYGAAVRCVNALTDPGNALTDPGCGHTDCCKACGIARAITQRHEARMEGGEVLLSAWQDDKLVAREYTVRTTPIDLEDTPLTVVALRDISDEKRREALEKVFFHDILNTITCLGGYTDLLQRDGADEDSELVGHIVYLGERLRREVLDQRALLDAERGTLSLHPTAVSPDAVLGAVERLFRGHLMLNDQILQVSYDSSRPELVTDLSLLLRVIVNMVKNAVEASRREDPVRLSVEHDQSSCTFHVHNQGTITADVARQIFKRSFSTKERRGRGLGTYSMKLFGERYLGGRVRFTTGPDGTTFSITLPLSPPTQSARET